LAPSELAPSEWSGHADQDGFRPRGRANALQQPITHDDVVAVGTIICECWAYLEYALYFIAEEMAEVIHSPRASLFDQCMRELLKCGGKGVRATGERAALTDWMLEFQLHFASQPMAHMVLKDGRRACVVCEKRRACVVREKRRLKHWDACWNIYGVTVTWG
jgi:hypothetical protein